MDGTLILEFQEITVAQACLNAINELAANYWAMQGYTILVVDGEKQLVGKNAATRLDEPGSTRTITWDTIKESPDNSWYFYSLSNDPRFVQGMEQLAAYDFVEKQMPAHWQADDDQA